MSDPQFVLASRSPRRRDLLQAAGYRFLVDSADLDETPLPAESPEQLALRLARAKAQALAARREDGLPVLAADTDVALDGEILGKPRDREHGIALLLKLSGRSHQVSSAVALAVRGRCDTLLCITEVEFGTISASAAADYWASGEPADKAGGYAIQGLGARWVRAIRGSYTSVVGLPLLQTCELLAAHGIHPASAGAA